MKFRRGRPEEPTTTLVLAAPAEDEFKVFNFTFFVSGFSVFSKWELFGEVNMSMSVRCRFKGFEADADALNSPWEALGVVDASRDDEAAVSTSAR